MKLYELLETSKKTGDMIVRDKYDNAFRYCEEIHGFVWCFRYNNGQYMLDSTDKSGYNRVFLNDNLLNDEWHLEPINKIVPMNINGINFTNYDKAIQYLMGLKRKNDALNKYRKVLSTTGIKPIIISDKETIEYINNEFNK